MREEDRDEVVKAVLLHVVELASTFSDNLEKLFKTYPELAHCIDFAMRMDILGERATEASCCTKAWLKQYTDKVRKENGIV